MRSFAGRVFLVLLCLFAVSPVRGDDPAGAQQTCDPTVDPGCGSYDPTYCDPTIDPACDPSYFDPGPAPIYCDPIVDPTCDPGYCDPIDDPFCDPTTVPVFDPSFGPGTTVPGYCDPVVDPTCYPGYCDPIDDPFCSPPDTVTTAPVLAFTEAPTSIESVVSRSDTTDDLTIDRIPSGEVAVVAASRLILGVDALAELGAFERMADPRANDLVREIRERVPADGLTADGYRNEIERLAEDLPLLIDQLESDGFEASDDVVDLAESLDDETIDAILDGETSVVEADIWLSALADLAVRGGAAPADPAERADDSAAVLGMVLLFAPEAEQATEAVDVAAEPDVAEQAPSTTVPPTTAAPVPTTGAPESAVDEPTGTSALLLIGGAIAGLLALVAFLLIRRRSKDDSVVATAVAEAADHKLTVNDLLDASRRMTASLDANEICAIAIAETERLVDGEGGLVAIRTASGLSPTYATPAELFKLDAIARSSLVRVTETGRSITTVATEEPVLVEVPMSMAAVPIIADGTITGAIMVVRVSSNPFVRDDLEALEMLAPLVGSALVAAEAHGSATALADVEPMTGLKNRRRLDRDLESTGDELVAYIMLDVDHFKNFNDVNGHAAGDEALRRVASTLAQSVRPGDVVYRYGGEEFCVLLPSTTAVEAGDVAERIRVEVEACAIPGEENQPSGTVTVSIGVADTASQPVASLVERADAALYEAKDSGRNQVVVDVADD